MPDAEREAADKLAKERLAREKAEREAKAKALAEQRQRDAANRAAEQAAERKRIETQRPPEPAPPSPPAPPAAPAVAAPPDAPPAPTKSVKEFCVRGNFISSSLCESRTCRDPARASDPTCKQLKLDDEARKQRQFQ
jgi:hypothetical protein